MSPGQKRRSASKSEILPVDSIFGPRPILLGEDALAYEALLHQVLKAVKPSDFIEKIRAYDVVYYTWESLRWRRVKINLVSIKVANVLSETLGPILRQVVGPEKAKTEEWSDGVIAVRWLDEDPELVAYVKLLGRSGKSVSFDSVASAALSAVADKIEGIDRLIAVAESRRNAALREIDRSRAAFARSLRGEIKKVEDAEFEIIELKSDARTGKANKKAA